MIHMRYPWSIVPKISQRHVDVGLSHLRAEVNQAFLVPSHLVLPFVYTDHLWFKHPFPPKNTLHLQTPSLEEAAV